MLSWQSQAHPYRIDDASVEACFANSTKGGELSSFVPVVSSVDHLKINARVENPEPAIALLLALLAGGFGVHRVYLGSSMKMVFLYIITCGGISGIVPLADAVVLFVGIMNNDIDKYIGNDRFIMWL